MMRDVRYAALIVILVPTLPALAGDPPTSRRLPVEAQLEYARSRLAATEKVAEFHLVADLGHREAFRIEAGNGCTVIEADSPAGLIYGAQAVVCGEARAGQVQRPEFDIRGTTLPMFQGGGYKATLSPETFPWFYDRQFLTRTLDTFAEARFNAIYLWGSHTFPYIVEMPKYPEASADVPPEQVRANQKQFLWFTRECEKRNIKVLLHFYNIHVSPPFAQKHRIRTNPTAPTPLLEEYTRYALGRYFAEFPSVGLYACPGESISSGHQLEWFRDVIFKAAKDSGRSPVIVIRDWTLNKDFQEQLKALYGNVHSELKHNDESITSPYPDVRHLRWEGLANGHIINAAHGPATDLQPMRWASPLLVQEMAQRWKSLGLVSGVEFWGQSFWHWPYTFDKLTGAEANSVVDDSGEHRLLYLDRDAPFYTLAGRAMWKADRDSQEDAAFWEEYYTKRVGSREIGRRMARWYRISGSISPGLQNLNATKVANFWATMLLMNQNVDQILNCNKNLSEIPYTLDREAGRAGQRYYPRPFDRDFFNRYQREYGEPKPGEPVEMYEAFATFEERMGVENLAQRHCMPVSQYAALLESGKTTAPTMTPDKVVRLLGKLATESLTLAEEMEAACTDPAIRPELQRFVADSEMYVLATQTMIHREDAAILKARMLLSGSADKAGDFLREMEASVKVYEKLAELTDGTYHFANGYRQYRWSNAGIAEFRKDLTDQRAWLESLEPIPEGAIRVEAESMAGPWRIGSDRYTGFSGTGYAASYYAAVQPNPEPMTAKVHVPKAGEYTVWVRALAGGSHQDRALAVEVADRRLEPTHTARGSAKGAFLWERAGEMKLPGGAAMIRIHPVGKGHPTADAILLAPDADWKPQGDADTKRNG